VTIKLGTRLEYQLALTEQINSRVEQASTTVPVLGVTLGEERWLIPMNDVGEVLPVPKITAVFLTQPWFLGAINVRGKLYGLCDLAQYCGGVSTRIGVKTRVLLIASRLGPNCAILAGCMLGIRSLSEFTQQIDCHDTRLFVEGVYRDRQGRIWRILNLPILMRLDSFFRIAR
jgi:twitching motility protein PilI